LLFIIFNFRLLEALVEILGVVLIQEVTMTTRSKKKYAAKQVTKLTTGPLFAPDPVTTDMNTPVASGATTSVDVKPPAAPETASDHALSNVIAASLKTPSSENVTIIAPLNPAPQTAASSTPPQTPIVHEEFLDLFKHFMIGQAEFQRRSTVDASAFRQTMEHSISSLKNDLCDSIIYQMKQMVVGEGASVSVPRPQSNLFGDYSHYYPAPPSHDDTDPDIPVDAYMDDTHPTHSRHHWNQDNGNPFSAPRDHPLCMVATCNNHCSKFKTYLPDMVTISDYSLVSLDKFVDNIKGALQASLSSHKS
jgi:hypothetical protein